MVFKGISSSEQTAITCEVTPHPINVYMIQLSQIITTNKTSCHDYVDDNQLYIKVSLGDYEPTQIQSECIENINGWMWHNFLQVKKQKHKYLSLDLKKNDQDSAHSFS